MVDRPFAPIMKFTSRFAVPLNPCPNEFPRGISRPRSLSPKLEYP